MVAQTQDGAVRLRRDALPWADLGLPFQGEEFCKSGRVMESSVWERERTTIWRMHPNESRTVFELSNLTQESPALLLEGLLSGLGVLLLLSDLLPLSGFGAALAEESAAAAFL